MATYITHDKVIIKRATCNSVETIIFVSVSIPTDEMFPPDIHQFIKLIPIPIALITSIITYWITYHVIPCCSLDNFMDNITKYIGIKNMFRNNPITGAA